jgi:hypothetical protein
MENTSLEMLQLLNNIVPVAPLNALLGLTADGVPLLVRVPAPDVRHILIEGASGSGKSALLAKLVLALSLTNKQADMQVVAFGGKEREGLGKLEGLPHLLTPVITNTTGAIRMLDRLEAHARRRRRSRWMPRPHIFLAIDNFDELLGSANARIGGTIERLLLSGPPAGIHIIATARKAVEQAGAFRARIHAREGEACVIALGGESVAFTPFSADASEVRRAIQGLVLRQTLPEMAGALLPEGEQSPYVRGAKRRHKDAQRAAHDNGSAPRSSMDWAGSKVAAGVESVVKRFADLAASWIQSGSHNPHPHQDLYRPAPNGLGVRDSAH